MSRADTARKTATDVPFRLVGVGHNPNRMCDAVKPSGFLCGKPSRSTGPARSYCPSCSAARAARLMPEAA